MQPGDIHFAAVVATVPAASDGTTKKVVLPLQCSLGEAAEAVREAAALAGMALSSISNSPNQIRTAALGGFCVFFIAATSPTALIVVGTKSWRCSSSIIAFVRRVRAEVARDADFGFWHLRSLVWRGEENIGTTTQDADDHYAMQPRLFEGRDWDEEDDPDSSEDIEDEDEDVESDYRAVLASTDTVNTNKLPSLAAGGGRSERVVLEKNAEDVMRQPTPSQNAKKPVSQPFPLPEQSRASLPAPTTKGVSGPPRSVSPVHDKAWDVPLFMANFDKAPQITTAVTTQSSSPQIPSDASANILSGQTASTRIEGGGTQPNRNVANQANSSRNPFSAVANFADFANFPSSTTPTASGLTSDRSSSNPSSGTAQPSPATPVHASSAAPTISSRLRPECSAYASWVGVQPSTASGMTPQQTDAGLSITDPWRSPTVSSAVSISGAVPSGPVEAGLFVGRGPIADSNSGADDDGGPNTSIGARDGTIGNSSNAPVETTGTQGSSTGAAVSTTGAGVVSTATTDPPLSLAVSEDLAYSHRGSTLQSYAITGAVLISASGIPSRVRVRDDHGHIATVKANATYAEEVPGMVVSDNPGFAPQTREYICKTPAVKTGASAGAKFLPVLMYRCSPAVKVLPVRVTCRLRVEGSAVLVWAQAIANPQLSKPLSGVFVLVHLPFYPQQDRGGVSSEPPAMWKPERRLLEWSLSTGIKPGGKQVMQARLPLEERGGRAGAIPATAPAMIKCTIMESSFSSVGLEVSGVAGLGDDAEGGLGKVAKRCRVECRQQG